MAVIQIRSGTYADYDPTKMHSAELAAILSGDPATEDGTSLNISFGAGNSKRILTDEDKEAIESEISAKQVTLSGNGTVTLSIGGTS